MKPSSWLRAAAVAAVVAALGVALWKLELAARHRARVSLGIESAAPVPASPAAPAGANSAPAGANAGEDNQ